MELAKIVSIWSAVAERRGDTAFPDAHSIYHQMSPVIRKRRHTSAHPACPPACHAIPSATAFCDGGCRSSVGKPAIPAVHPQTPSLPPLPFIKKHVLAFSI